jgi:hypothetical protein
MNADPAMMSPRVGVRGLSADQLDAVLAAAPYPGQCSDLLAAELHGADGWLARFASNQPPHYSPL